MVTSRPPAPDAAAGPAPAATAAAAASPPPPAPRLGAALRADFPIFARPYHGRRLAYLDSGASAQKPRAVLDAMAACHETYYANVHRGAYELSLRSTEAAEAARETVARWLGVPAEGNSLGLVANVVFTRGTTEAINLVARCWGAANLRAGDVVLLTQMEHHANIVPWHQLAAERGVTLRWIPVRPDDGTLDLAALPALLADGRVRLGAVAHASNVLGTINPVREIADALHAAGALLLVDGAQAAAHFPPRVAEIGCDFYACSAHKMLGPTGVGALYARAELLEAMPAWLGGGDMIREVRFDGWEPNEIPYKFEAGTPAIVEQIGFGAALDYLAGLGPEAALAHEERLTARLIEMLRATGGVRLFGPPAGAGRVGAVSFALDDVHPHDIATILDAEGVCVRAGHHCAQPLMGVLGVGATTRASLHVYNDEDDVEALAAGLARVRAIFA